MKTYFILFFFFLSSYLQGFEETLKRLTQLPEVAVMIEEIKLDGKITFAWGKTSSFEALWDANKRTIWINPKQAKNGSLFSTLLFEIHNAASNKTFMALVEQAKKGLITKEDYVKQVEELEFNNALKTARLLRKGIRLHLFPKEAEWDISEDFEEHYAIQQIYGHSAWLAKNFELLSPYKNQIYRGTIPDPKNLSSEDKKTLLRYFGIKKALKDSSYDAFYQIQRELAFFEACHLNPKQTFCQGSNNKKRLFTFVFH